MGNRFEETDVNETLYEANPSMVRMYPLTVVIAVLLIPVFGIGLLILLWLWIQSKMDKLTIRSSEVIYTHGLLSKSYTELSMHSIRSVKITQSLLRRVLNAGNVAIFSAGDRPEVVIKGLPDPGEIRELIKGRSAVGEAA